MDSPFPRDRRPALMAASKIHMRGAAILRVWSVGDHVLGPALAGHGCADATHRVIS